MSKLLEAERLIGEAADYAHLISLVINKKGHPCDPTEQALARAALRISILNTRTLDLLDEIQLAKEARKHRKAKG